MVWYKINVVLAIVFASFVSGYQAPKKTTISCKSDADCTSVPFTICGGNTPYIPGVCSCTIAYVLRQVGNKFDCLDEAKLFKDPCQIDDQCKATFGESGACIQNKCRCSPGAHFINFKCWKSSKLGEACGDPNNCVATDNSQCNGICSCVPGFIGNPANTKCLKIAQKLGDACEDSVQCTPVNQQASCQYKVCLCPEGYTPQGNNGCVKTATPPPPPRVQYVAQKFGDACENSVQCTSVNQLASCQFGVCLCPQGYTPQGWNHCVKTATPPRLAQLQYFAQKLGDWCDDTVQCTSVDRQAYCEYNICLCPKGYIPEGNTRCVKSTKRLRVPKGYNSAAGLKESAAMIFIAIVMLVLKY